MTYKDKNIKLISVIYIVLSIMLAIAVSIQPYFLKSIIDNFRDLKITKFYIILYGVAILAIILFEYGIKISAIKLRVDMKNLMTSQIIDYIEEDKSIIKNHDYVADVNVDINTNIEDFINDYYINKLDIIILSINILIYSYAIINLDFMLILLILIPNILTLSIPYFFRSKIEEFKNNSIKANKIFNGKVLDYILGINVIENMFATSDFKKVLGSSLSNNLKAEEKLGKLESGLEILIGLISYLGLFVLIAYGSFSIYSSKMSLGAFIAAIQFSDLIITPLINLITTINTLSSGKAAYKTIEKRFEKKVEETIKPIEVNDFGAFQGIEIDRLNFSYHDNLDLSLKDIRINRADKVLVRGNSGSGKSTFLNIITGNIKDYQGEIYFNGHELKDLEYDYLNHYFSIISQNQYIFNMGLEDNIKLYSLIDFNDFSEIFDLVKYYEISKNDPTSQSLSGGEKQRVALLRALIRDKEILVIDEGLNQVQKKLRNEILDFFLDEEDLTFIYVSHDIDDYIDSFDLIIDMD